VSNWGSMIAWEKADPFGVSTFVNYAAYLFLVIITIIMRDYSDDNSIKNNTRD